MDSRTIARQRGIRMAMQVAALSVGAGAAAMALVASEAKADDAPGRAAAGAALDSPGGSQDPTAGLEPARVTGWSCMGPTSRGPLAPPAQAEDEFEALLAEVPS
jgi:hypothetical protein